MDLNEIVVFAKVVETRSFTAAAQQLGLPKSTVSRKVSQLEERLAARLLQRTTRKLSLTEIGQAYYERCQRQGIRRAPFSGGVSGDTIRASHRRRPDDRRHEADLLAG